MEIAMKEEKKPCCCRAYWKTWTVVSIVGIGAVIAVLVIVLTLNSGGALGVPPIQPPVTDSTPEQLTLSSRRERRSLYHCDLQNHPGCTYSIGILKERWFIPKNMNSGQNDLSYRLYMVDQRMAELDKRAQEERPRLCLDDALQTWSPPAFVGGNQFTMRLNCAEELSSNSFLAFGVDDTHAYLAELQDYGGGSGSSGAPSMAVLAKVTLDGNEVHVFEIHTVYSGNTATSSEWKEIKADRAVASKTLEISFGTTESGDNGFGCGMQFYTDSNYILAKGHYDGQNCGTIPLFEECFQASDLTAVSNSNCPFTYTTGNITQANIQAESGDTTAMNLITSFGDMKTLGLRDFNEAAGFMG